MVCSLFYAIIGAVLAPLIAKYLFLEDKSIHKNKEGKINSDDLNYIIILAIAISSIWPLFVLYIIIKYYLQNMNIDKKGE